MIRFPNPGSDIPTLIRIFQVLYSYLEHNQPFSLDDMSKTLTQANLASSSGYMGEEALSRSTRKDRSRDPLYNQSKMYAEVYRVLGWIQSTEESRLKYHFTLLGEHMAVAKNNPYPLFCQCLLGINYPNKIIEIKDSNVNKPFYTILRSLKELDGSICRDEITLGPLSINYSENNYTEMINWIKGIRNSPQDHVRLKSELEKLSKELNIQINTLRNYTRFPMAALKYTKWVEEKNITIYKGTRKMLSLTEKGKETIEWIENAENILLPDIEDETVEVINSYNRIGFFEMLERAECDIQPVTDKIASDQITLETKHNQKHILYSPYQTLPQQVVNESLSSVVNITKGNKSVYEYKDSSQIIVEKGPSFEPVNSTLFLQKTVQTVVDSNNEPIEDEIKKISIANNNSVDKVVKDLVDKFSSSNKDDFYPLVSSLFRVLGFNCINPRHGINYQRWDAIIIDNEYSIPIEIKSPSEEEYLSVKAVRQALENKIVLLSRKLYTTDFDTVSLAIGYKCPNPRSDVYRLINDIKRSYGIKIGILDIETLFYLTVKKVIEGKNIDINILKNMEGLINVKDI